MSDAVTRVQRFFAERGCAIEIISCTTSVHTAQQAAAALETSVQHIVKALLFEADGRPVLVLCGGDRRVDTAKLAAVCAAQQVRKASAALTKSTTGYSIGGVPPVAHAMTLPIFMDAALLACDTVYAAAGTARALFAIAPQVLQALSGAQIAALGEAEGEAQMSDTAQDVYTTINGLRVHYRQWGQPGRQALVLLHASGCHAHWWDWVGPLLAVDYSVIAPDLRGHGDSEHPQPPEYHFDAYVADLAQLVDRLSLQDFFLVGHSMGGYIGLRYASTQPAALRAMITADMLCEVDGEALARLHQASTRPQPRFATRAEAEQRFRLQPPETTAAPDVLQVLAREAVCQTAEQGWTFKFDRRALNHPAVHVWDILPRIVCPVLVVHGALSPLMPAANAERVAQRLANGQWTTLAAAYHNLMLDNPTGFVQMVRNFCRHRR